MARPRSQKSSKSADETSMPEMDVPGDATLSEESGSGSGPTGTPPDEVSGISFADAGAGAPAATPPESAQQAFGATTWHSDKRITALWSINQYRNSWVHIGGIGWKRLAVKSDSAIVALSMIGAHAKQLQSRVDLREESDGLIHEIYSW